MTVYTGSTQESLQQVSTLITYLNSAPVAPQGVAADIWDTIGEELKKIIQPIVDAITSALAPVWQNIQSWINNTITPIVTGVTNTVTTVINNITGGISDAINGFVTWLQNTINSIGDWFDNLLGQIKNTIENVSNWLTQAIGSIGDWISNAVNSVIEGVGAFIAGVVTEVSDWLTTAYENVKTTISNVVNAVGEWFRQTSDNIAAWINGVVKGIVETYNSARKSVEELIAGALNWASARLGELSNWFWARLSDLGAWFAREVMPKFNNAVIGAQKLLELGSIVWDAISSGDYTKAFNLLDSFAKGLGIPAPVATLRAIVSSIAYFWETVHLQFVGMEVRAQREAEIALGLTPLDMGSMAQSVYRGLASEQDFINNARIGGMVSSRAKLGLESSRPLPTPGQIQESFLRGEIDVKTHDRLLASYGLSSDNIELIKELYLLIPGASDLIRMAVREAFTPDIAQKFGQYQDLPQAFIDWGAKIGLSKDWCSRYWAAHWELPSATMGFEMLHRGVISNEELTLLLRALDVMPFWRERLIKISYNPLTRVDVRRMYQLGVINEEQVKRSYLDLGYDNQKADWLTQFTIRYYTPEDQTEQDTYKSLARSVYSSAFKKRIISEDEYRQFLLNLKIYPDDVELLISIDNFSIENEGKIFDLKGYRQDWQKLLLQAYDRGLLHINEVTPMLIELGYEESEANLEISLIDYNRQLTIRNMVADRVHDQYTTFIIDNVGAHTLLDQFNFTSEEINKLVEEWNIERSIRVKRPPLSDLRKFFTAGMLTLDQFLDELRGEGYNERYIDLYAQQLAKG